MKNQFIKKLIFLLFISFNATAQDGKFSFTLPSAASTSAGVFINDSILVRTLWNNVNYSTGTYTEHWDGKDDYGNAITSPAATYKIKVLSNNVRYAWQGTIGNTSDSMTGSAKHRGYSNCMTGLSFGSSFGYFCTGYSEGSSSAGKFNINKPNIKIEIFPSGGTTGNINYTATDGTNVYWGVQDAFSANNNFVFGTKVSDDSETGFSDGVAYTVTYGKAYAKVISLVNAPNARISGLAVQKTGNYLFVARMDLNQLQVLNKITGALLKTLTFISPRGISVDGGGNLWMVSGTNTLAKYGVNTDGTLTGATLTLPGLTAPLSTQVSPDGIIVSVADGGTSQQVKCFNNSTGSAISTLGTLGGYTNDATVSNSKFYFNENDVPKNARPFIAYQADGSFWVNDAGNSRVQHYSAASSFLDRIMYLGSSYSTWVDKGNINRVFCRYLEFEIDYSVQNLSGNTGWTLVKNWGANVTTGYDDAFQNMKPITLSNGRTYAMIVKGSNSEVVELMGNGTMRFTGILKNTVGYNSHFLCEDGSLQLYNEDNSVPIISTIKRFPLIGFDGSNNPLWSTTPELLATAITNTTLGNPVATPRTQVFSPTTNKVVLYNYKAYSNNMGPVFSSGFHLGLMQKGSNNKYLFQTEKSTHRNYGGDFPKAGMFDIGNGVSDFAGGNVNIVDKNIITSYHGEFWKASQTNKYNHYYDNGLAIGQFGTTRPQVGFGNHAAAMMAGNALTPVVAKDSNGDLYLYHGDESDHSGVHRWKITGLNTVSEQSVIITYPTSFAVTTNYLDLMAGLPFDAKLLDNTAGWTRNPVADENILYNWVVKTSVFKYDKANTTDVFINFSQAAAATYNVSRDLGTNNVTDSWKITGSVSFGSMLNGLGNNAYMEVLDANGKLLTTLYALNNYSSPIRLFMNTAAVPASVIGGRLSDTIKSFEISIKNGIVSFNYGSYAFPTTTISDPTGNWKTPKTLRLRFTSAPGMPNYDIKYDVSDLRFFKDYAVIAPYNKAPTADAGSDKTITLPTNSSILSGSGTDTDGTISSYGWVKISGPASGTIATANAATTTINNLIQGFYKFELTVTDNSGATGKDTIQVTVNAAGNVAPVAIAGSDKTITLPTNSTTLSGSGTDTDGTISSYGWLKISGPASGIIATANAAATTINNLIQGFYKFELTVTDNSGSTGKDTIQIAVLAAPISNKIPVANAGADIDILLPTNTAQLKGAGVDLDGTIVTYNWKVIKGPSGYSIINTGVNTTTIENLFQGVYELEFTVTDNMGASAKDTLNIAVSSPRLSSFTKNKFKVFPNPVKDLANLDISTTNLNTKLFISLFDLKGRLVKYYELVTNAFSTVFKLDLTNLSNGYYVINLRFDDGQLLSQKIIKYGGR